MAMCAAVVLCTACTGGGSGERVRHPSQPIVASGSWPVVREPAGDGVGTGLTVRRPPGWHVYRPQGVMPAQFVYPIGSITSAPEHVTCHRTTNGDATAFWCDPPRPKLRPDGVLIDWVWIDLERPECAACGGSPMTIDGWHAAWQVEAPDCGGVGATQTIDVRVFEHRWVRVWLELRACIRGPDTARADATVRAIVRSLRFARTPTPA